MLRTECVKWAHVSNKWMNESAYSGRTLGLNQAEDQWIDELQRRIDWSFLNTDNKLRWLALIWSFFFFFFGDAGLCAFSSSEVVRVKSHDFVLIRGLFCFVKALKETAMRWVTCNIFPSCPHWLVFGGNAAESYLPPLLPTSMDLLLCSLGDRGGNFASS